MWTERIRKARNNVFFHEDCGVLFLFFFSRQKGQLFQQWGTQTCSWCLLDILELLGTFCITEDFPFQVPPFLLFLQPGHPFMSFTFLIRFSSFFHFYYSSRMVCDLTTLSCFKLRTKVLNQGRRNKKKTLVFAFFLCVLNSELNTASFSDTFCCSISCVARAGWWWRGGGRGGAEGSSLHASGRRVGRPHTRRRLRESHPRHRSASYTG